MTPFRDLLGRIVAAAPGGIGAVLVDAEGEAIDLFTRGDSFETRLVGAHHGIVLKLIERALAGNGNGAAVESVSIRSERYNFSIAPLRDGVFVVLIQDGEGIPALGMKALLDGVTGLDALI